MNVAINKIIAVSVIFVLSAEQFYSKENQTCYSGLNYWCNIFNVLYTSMLAFSIYKLTTLLVAQRKKILPKLTHKELDICLKTKLPRIKYLGKMSEILDACIKEAKQLHNERESHFNQYLISIIVQILLNVVIFWFN